MDGYDDIGMKWHSKLILLILFDATYVSFITTQTDITLRSAITSLALGT